MSRRRNKKLPSMDEIISHFNMKKHIEGGFGSLFYEDCGYIKKDSLPSSFDSSRPYFNGIYFLVPQGITTIFHQLPINELWHFCLGGPLEIYEITLDGKLKKTILSPDIKQDHRLAYVVEKGSWFGTQSLGEYTLVTCTTSPGFRSQDFRLGKRKELITLFPHMKDVILRFTLADESAF